MRIRKYKNTDKRECVKLITSSLGVSCGKLCRGQFSAKTGNGPNDYSFFNRWVAIEKDKIIGVCGIYRTNSTPSGFWGIDWFVVDESQRNNGVGRALLLTATKGVKGKIFVWATKRAMKFYSKMGFEFLESDSAYFMVR